jgi:hypothetical protein
VGVVAVLKRPLSAVVIATLLTAKSGPWQEPLIIVGVVVAYVDAAGLRRLEQGPPYRDRCRRGDGSPRCHNIPRVTGGSDRRRRAIRRGGTAAARSSSVSLRKLGRPRWHSERASPAAEIRTGACAAIQRLSIRCWCARALARSRARGPSA